MITKIEDQELVTRLMTHINTSKILQLIEGTPTGKCTLSEFVKLAEQLLTRFSEELERSARAQDTSQHLRSELYTAARDRDMYRVQVADLEETLIRERKALRNERNVRDHRRNKRILIIASHEAAGKLKNDQISNQARQISNQASTIRRQRRHDPTLYCFGHVCSHHTEHVYDGIRYRELKVGETWQAGDAFVIANCTLFTILSSNGYTVGTKVLDDGDLNLRPIDQTNDTAP